MTHHPPPWASGSQQDLSMSAAASVLVGSAIKEAERSLTDEMEDDGEFVRLGARRFKNVVRRVNDLLRIDHTALDADGAREAFVDARRAAQLLISDKLARRSWLRRTWERIW